VPIIFLTSLSESEALVRCLEAGGDDFLQALQPRDPRRQDPRHGPPASQATVLNSAT
jgi:CheY-like chemotaxis protein